MKSRITKAISRAGYSRANSRYLASFCSSLSLLDDHGKSKTGKRVEMVHTIFVTVTDLITIPFCVTLESGGWSRAIKGEATSSFSWPI